jgi:hypothetical protein
VRAARERRLLSMPGLVGPRDEVLGRPPLVGEDRVADADAQRVEPARPAPETDRRSRLARCSASSHDVSGTSTQNSSPPTRTTVSWSRTARSIDRATSLQDLVAGRVAEAVVDLLEAVEVEGHEQ